MKPEVESGAYSNCTDKYFFRTESFKIPFRLYQHQFSNVTNEELNDECVPESYQARHGYNVPSRYGNHRYYIGCHTHKHTASDLCDVKLFDTPKYKLQREKLYPNISGVKLFRKDHNTSRKVSKILTSYT